MTLTITVTVGRNIAGAPMTAEHWESLQRRVRTILAYATTGHGRIESHYGVGVWDGVVEDSAKVTRYGTAWGQERNAAWLRAELGEVARVYRQDAIALVIGEGELIGPDPLPPVRRAEPVYPDHPAGCLFCVDSHGLIRTHEPRRGADFGVDHDFRPWPLPLVGRPDAGRRDGATGTGFIEGRNALDFI